MYKCLICQQDFAESVKFPCHHRYCKSCMYEYLKLRIIESKVSSMPCPNTSCPYLLKIKEIELLTSPELFSKYQIFARNLELSQNPNLRFCPKADCQGYDIGNSKKRKLTCNECTSDFCYYCNETWHGESSCKRANEHVFDIWSLKNNVRSCPNCHRRVEKAGGCPSMECPVCKFKWCWYCGLGLRDGHDPMFCIFAQESWQLRYWFVAFLVLGYVTVPFGVGLFMIHISQNYLTDSDKESKLISKIIKWRLITYPIIVLISPAMTIFLMAGSGFFVIYINKAAFKPYSTGCYSRTFKNKSSRCLLMFIVAMITTCVICTLTLIVYAFVPAIGVVFLIKRVCTDIKTCRKKTSRQSKGYVQI